MSFNKHNPDILDCISNLSNDEVFTPPPLVNKLLDMLPVHVWSDPNLKWLDPSCKTGIFLREIAKRLWIGLEKTLPDEDLRREHIFKNMLWGIALTELTSLSSRRTLYYSKDASSKFSIIQFSSNEGKIIYDNIEHTFNNKNICTHCGCSFESIKDRKQESHEMHAYQFIHQSIEDILKEKNMKFDVIIGNPPYQMNDGGHGASASPLYHLFIEKAKELNPQYISMIIPSRWYSSGKGLDTFRQNMLNDSRMKKLVDFTDANECFPGVEIKGGVCYFLWDSLYNGKCEVTNNFNNKTTLLERNLNDYEVFVRFNSAITILNKVLNLKQNKLSSKISSRNPFGFATNFTDFEDKDSCNSSKIYLRGKVGYIKTNSILKNKDLIDAYKVLLPKAGEGDGKFPNKIIGTPILTEPNTCCTETYLVANHFNNVKECENFLLYLKTKFVRFLISLRKSTQDTTKDKFEFVPDLNMNRIWTDEILYKFFKLNSEEINFIESMIKEME